MTERCQAADPGLHRSKAHEREQERSDAEERGQQLHRPGPTAGCPTSEQDSDERKSAEEGPQPIGVRVEGAVAVQLPGAPPRERVADRENSDPCDGHDQADSLKALRPGCRAFHVTPRACCDWR